MKLSKAQQVVVDRMREGWTLHLGEYMRDKEGRLHKINSNTFTSLVSKNIVDEVDHIDFSTTFSADYRLTEQFKTKQNEG